MTFEPPGRAVRLRSPFARAVVPVIAGASAIALILLATWGVAALISGGGADLAERLAPPTFRIGDIDDVADEIAERGPLLFPGLNTTTGLRTVVLDHRGTDPTRGWHTYWAYPADRDPSCPVVQTQGTSTFTDCDGRELDVSELAPPAGVHPEVRDRRVLYIDLQGATTPSTTST